MSNLGVTLIMAVALDACVRACVRVWVCACVGARVCVCVWVGGWVVILCDVSPRPQEKTHTVRPQWRALAASPPLRGAPTGVCRVVLVL